MKRIFFTLLFYSLMQWGFAQNSPQNPELNLTNGFNKDSISVLDFYRQYSSFTDPGEYEYLYDNLPDSLPELCDLIRSQFVHPYAHLPRVRNQFPEERRNDEQSNIHP